MTCHLCLHAPWLWGTVCDKQDICTLQCFPRNGSVCVCAGTCVCVWLVDCQMRFQYLVQCRTIWANHIIKGVRFRARGISKAVHVLAVCAFYCFYISLCETWEKTSAMPWRKNRNIWIDYSRFWICYPALSLMCPFQRDSAFILFTYWGISVAILRSNTVVYQTFAYIHMRHILHCLFV